MKGFASLGKGVLKVTSYVKKSGGVFKALKVALGGVSGTVLAVVAVVALLVAAFVDLWKNNEEFRAKVTAIWESIKAKFQAFCPRDHRAAECAGLFLQGHYRGAEGCVERLLPGACPTVRGGVPGYRHCARYSAGCAAEYL